MTDLLDRAGRSCHAAYCEERKGGKLHKPEDCPYRNTMSVTACAGAVTLFGADCFSCRPALREWDALTEAARETFRAQARPVLAIVEPEIAQAQAREMALREALLALKAWVNSDAVKGMGEWAAVHGYRLDEAYREQGAPAWAKVENALATPAAGWPEPVTWLVEAAQQALDKLTAIHDGGYAEHRDNPLPTKLRDALRPFAEKEPGR